MSRKEMRKTTRPIRAEAAKRFRKEASSMEIGSEWLEGTIGGLNEKLQFEGRLGQQWLKANYDFAISAIKEAEAPWNPKVRPKPRKTQPRSKQYSQLYNWSLTRGRLERLSVFEVHDTFVNQA